VSALHAQDVNESANARHAALFLHGMAPADRAWVLDAIPEEARASLQSLLAELQALGIASDPALISDAILPMGRACDPAVRTAALSDEDVLLALRGERLVVVIDALRREPAGLLASWLRMADWPWREDLLRALEPAHRTRVVAALAFTRPVPPAMREELIAAVAARLRQPVPRGRPPGRWRAVAQALRRMWRSGRMRRRAPH